MFAGFLSLLFLLVSLGDLGLHQDCSLTGNANFRLEIVAEKTLLGTSGEVAVQLDDGLQGFYVADRKDKRVGRIGWEREGQLEWVLLDKTNCSSPLQPIEVMRVLGKWPYVIVLYCDTVVLLDKITLTPVRTFNPNPREWVFSIATSFDGQFIATGSRKETEREDRVRVLRTMDSSIVAEWQGSMLSLQFMPDGQHLATVFARNPDSSALRATDCGVAIYEVSSGKKVVEWTRSTTDPPCPESLFALPPDTSGRLISKNFYQGGMAVWEAKTGRLVRRLAGGGGRVPQWISISHDGRFAGADLIRPEDNNGPRYELIVWNIEDGRVVYAVPADGCGDPILDAQFSSQGNYLAVARATSIQLYRYSPD